MRPRRFAVLCRVSQRRDASGLHAQFTERYGIRVRSRGLVFVTDDTEDARRWREMGRR